jgi:hypothetical protein
MPSHSPDGTFSIVNPETSAPYPGTLGMEKEKPYRCEVCGHAGMKEGVVRKIRRMS